MKTKKTKTTKTLTPAQKRAAIAKDVLAQIETEKLVIARGSFVLAPSGVDFLNKRRLCSKSAPVCKVCAVGAAIVSGIKLFNKIILDCSNSDNHLHMQEWFEIEQKKLIEVAFERGIGYYDKWDFDDKVQYYSARKFGEAHSNNTDRAIAIFQNIIKNKGEFRP